MKAVFLDRDGVINELVYHEEMGIIESPINAEQFKLLPNVGGAIKIFNQMAYKVIVVSNQPGLAKKHFSKRTFEEISRKMREELTRSGAFLDDELYCFHHPDAMDRRYLKNCGCRKPEPGLMLKAADKYKLDLKESYMIGDSLTDIKAGRRAGCKTILIGKMKCDLCRLMDEAKVKPDYITPSLWDAAKIIRNGGK